jgi:hypothetical protein
MLCSGAYFVCCDSYPWSICCCVTVFLYADCIYQHVFRLHVSCINVFDWWDEWRMRIHLWDGRQNCCTYLWVNRHILGRGAGSPLDGEACSPWNTGNYQITQHNTPENRVFIVTICLFPVKYGLKPLLCARCGLYMRVSCYCLNYTPVQGSLTLLREREFSHSSRAMQTGLCHLQRWP